MYDSLAGKVAMITGAANGIGLSAAQCLASAGARLVLSDIDEAAGKKILTQFHEFGLDAHFVRCDVTDGQSVQALINFTLERYDRIDCAVNNAGIEHPHTKLADLDDDDFDRVIAVNLKGVYLCLKHELKAMLRQGFGVIVNTASLAGLGGAPALGGYAASKHGVMGLTRTAALEYARRGIRVNAVCPSFTNTDMVKRMVASDPRLGQRLNNASPMKRMGEPDEVARAIAWLCSDESSYVNGQGLALDGGISAW
ncbi:MAG: glucose 1-dehydrogenase [Gammaproteobacteria bacterium]|nr:glucose 1-dehydrogenase [Gammaproteobacteria bacterium]